MTAPTIAPHRGYSATDIGCEDREWHCRLDIAGDVICAASATPEGLQAAFNDSVDDYLAWCAEDGHAPQPPRIQEA